MWPGYLVHLGGALARATENYPETWETFEQLQRILNWRHGAGGVLTLSIEDAKELKLELEEVVRFHHGEIGLPYHVSQEWHAFWSKFFEPGTQTGDWRREDAVSVEEIIGDGLRLCDVSITSGNPIEFIC